MATNIHGESPLAGLLRNLALSQKIQQRTSAAATVIGRQRQAVLSNIPSWAKPIVIHGLDHVTGKGTLPQVRPMSQDELMTAAFGRADYSKYDYTKEDAVYFRNRAEGSTLKIDSSAHTLKMDETFIQNNAALIQENRAIIQRTKTRNFFSSGTENFAKNIDYMAFVYAASQERIRSEASGDEMKSQLAELDALTNITKHHLARDFADAVGGVFEENGVSGEKERLYQSVLTEMDNRMAQYSAHIEENRDYADINGPQEEWLRQDTLFMAAELRRAVASSDVARTNSAADPEGYTWEETQKLQVFATELVSYSQYVSSGTKAIYTGGESEESLGMKLASLTLKGEMFSQYANVSERAKGAVTRSIENFIKNSLDKEQAFNEKWMSIQTEAQKEWFAKARAKGRPESSETEEAQQIAKIQKSFTALDSDAVYAVIDTVMGAYEKTKDAGNALIEGAVFAHNTYAAKLQDVRYGGVNRYDALATYWNNFFVNKDKSSHRDAYIQKESGLEGMFRAFAGFMDQIAPGEDTLLKKPRLSANA